MKTKSIWVVFIGRGNKAHAFSTDSDGHKMYCGMRGIDHRVAHTRATNFVSERCKKCQEAVDHD